MSINSLPNEVLLEIVQRVDSGTALAGLSASCKHLSDLIRPVLYSTFIQTGRHSIGCFLRTISLKPDLAHCVKRCYLRAPLRTDFEPLEAQFTFEGLENDTNMRTWVRAQLSNELYGSEFCDIWLSKIFSIGNWDAIVAFLLVILSENLEAISIDNYSAGDGLEYIDEVLEIMSIAQKTSVSTKSLSRLSQVSIKFDTSQLMNNIDSTVPWLELPSVQVLRATDTILSLSPYIRLENRVLQTTFLSLSCRHVCPEDIAEFLNCFHFLQKYSYHHKLPRDMTFLNLGPYSPVAGLRNSAHCLEKITLSQENPLGLPDYEFGTVFLPCSFRDYKMLRYLDINIHIALAGVRSEAVYHQDDNDEVDDLPPEKVVFFHNCLPDSLEHLMVRECNRTIFGHLRPLFGGFSHLPPNLRTIKLVSHEPARLVDRKNTNWEKLAFDHGVVLTRERQSDHHANGVTSMNDL